MNDYISLRAECTPCNPDITDLLASQLADIGFESFEVDDSGLTAYIPAYLFDADRAREAADEMPIPCRITLSHQLVAGRDWNEEWERNYFQPIVIGDRCVIHSSFHKDFPHCEYDITIDPRMAFGTGHHATTSMMVNHLLELDLRGKKVIDMGTGTGILAILAMMRGAAEAYGIEIDPVACENAIDNVELNNVSVRILSGDSSRLADLPTASEYGGQGADLFIANINRNVILADFSRYAAALRPGGVMLLSGFYTADTPLIMAAASRLGLSLDCAKEAEEGWTALRLIKS